MEKLYVYDWEVTKNISEVSFLSYDSDHLETFIIDSDIGQDDTLKIREFIKGKVLVGYNNKTYDDIITNFVVSNSSNTPTAIKIISDGIIHGQKDPNFNLYKEFKKYLKSDLYFSIDLMRLLFSKKLRVSLKELECSLNHDNVEEFEFEFDKPLSSEQKEKLISYNINDCRATKLVLQKSIDALKLRRWMKSEYGIDAFSLDGVNGGVKILAHEYEKSIGNKDFLKEITRRKWIHIKDIILPFIQFETKEFQNILKIYQDHTWYSSHFDEKLFLDSKLKFEPIINGFQFKYSLGGLHGNTKSGIWESNDEYEILSIDVSSYYPSMILEYNFIPEHLDQEKFHYVYSKIRDERLEAKRIGNDIKNETLKLSINGKINMK